MRNRWIFANLFWVGTLLATAFPSPCLAREDHPDAKSEQLASIPGLSAKQTFEALHAAILDGCGKPQCNRYYFPADLLAAAYGLHEEGKVFEPSRWRIWAPRLELSLAEAKRGPTLRNDLPEFVFMNLPGLGRRHYDCGLIRGLVGTEIFPYPMRMKFLNVQGTKLPVVILNRSAYYAKYCFSKIDKDHPGCPEAVAQLVEYLESKNPKAKRSNEEKSAMPFLPTNIPFTVPTSRSTADADHKDECEDFKQKRSSADFLACIKGWGDRAEKPIEIRSVQRKQFFDCDYELNKAERDAVSINAAACAYRFQLIIPQTTHSKYERIVLKISLSAERIVAVCPPSTDTTRNITRNCRANEGKLEVTDEALMTEGDQSERTIPFSVIVGQEKSATHPRLLLVLYGVDGGSGKPSYGWWCWNTDCSQDELERLKAH